MGVNGDTMGKFITHLIGRSAVQGLDKRLEFCGSRHVVYTLLYTVGTLLSPSAAIMGALSSLTTAHTTWFQSKTLRHVAVEGKKGVADKAETNRDK